MVYCKEGKIFFQLFCTRTEMEEIRGFLNSNTEDFGNFYFTGGKGFKLYQEFSEKLSVKQSLKLFNEFEANAKGADLLYYLEKEKNLKSSLVVTIGTGTSIVLKTGNNTHVEHIGGTALGGAFFMGLLKILYDDIDFQTAINLAKEGDRFNIDLKVGDIYDLKDKRVEITTFVSNRY
ncbi:MAG: hypothetical protein ACTSWY_07120 [Promethearchaeota archaeon]